MEGAWWDRPQDKQLRARQEAEATAGETGGNAHTARKHPTIKHTLQTTNRQEKNKAENERENSQTRHRPEMQQHTHPGTGAGKSGQTGRQTAEVCEVNVCYMGSAR